MTDQMDSDQPDGNNEQPNSSASSGGDKHSSETVAVSKTEWDALQKTIKRLESGLQSDKDRAVRKTNERLDKFEQEISPMFDRVLELVSGGKSKEEALRVAKTEVDDRESKEALLEIAKRFKDGTLQLPNPSGNGNVGGDAVTEVIQKYGIDANDPEVVDIYKRWSDPKDAKIAALELVTRRATQTQSATATTSVQGTPPQSKNVDQLTAEYQQKMIDAAFKPDLIRQIKSEYAKKGVPVDQVAFT